jgi:HK97 family phage major capsid protein
MRTEKEIKEVRAGLVYQLEDLEKGFQGRKVTDEEDAKFDKIWGDIRDLDKELERNRKIREQRALLAEADLSQGGPAPKKDQKSGPTYRETFKKWLRYGMSGLSAEERNQMIKRGTDPQSTTNTAGGYTIPEDFGDELINNMAVYGGILGISNVMRTETGAALPFPTLDETSVKGTLVAENAQIAVNDMTFGQKVLNAYVYSSGIVLLPLQLLQDNGVNLESELSPIFAERLGRIAAEHLATGDGIGKPNGAVSAAGALGGSYTAAVSSITRDDVLELIYGVDRAYRQSPNTRLVFNDQTMLALRKLDHGTSDARPLFQLNARAGEPDTIEGFQYVVDNDIADIGASNVSMLFGDFSKYRVRLVNDFTFVQFDEKYMDSLQKGYMAYMRMDADLLDSSAIKKLSHAAS